MRRSSSYGGSGQPDRGDRPPAVGDGKIGPITRKLQELYFDVVRGKVPKYKHWCTPVY